MTVLVPKTKVPEIEREKLFIKLGYLPHSSAQLEFHTSPARFRIPTCGRRWGKTVCAANDLTYYAFNPDSYYWICGPTYKLAEKEFRVFHRNITKVLGIRPKKMQFNVNQGQMRIEMPWNTVVEAVSADRPDSLLGEGLDGVVMSEAARHKMSTWQQFIEPALADKRGWATFPSTPKGFNWYKGLYDLGKNPEYPEYESWRFPSWTNPIAFPAGRFDKEILRIESVVSPQYFAQEYGADFTTREGAIYDEFSPEIHVKKIDYVPHFKNYLAFDFGFAAPFVCLDIMVDPEENVYVWREYQRSYLSTWEHGHVLRERENPDGFHIDAMFGDWHGADAIATLAAILGYVVAEEVGWEIGVETVKRWLKPNPVTGKPKLFIDYRCTELIRQMQQLRKPEEKEDRNPKEGKQHDYDDHGPDALRYFFGPYFVLGRGRYALESTLSKASESETFFTYHEQMRLEHHPVGGF